MTGILWVLSEILGQLHVQAETAHLPRPENNSFVCRGDHIPLTPSEGMSRWTTRYEEVAEPAASQHSLSTRVVEHDVFRNSHNIEPNQSSSSDNIAKASQCLAKCCISSMTQRSPIPFTLVS